MYKNGIYKYIMSGCGAYAKWGHVLERQLDELLALKKRSRYWLAKQTGISEQNLRKLAKGKTTGIEFETLEKICRALQCTPNDFLILSEDATQKREDAVRKKH
jgi:putative transcriptional regulator